ncbi:tape measure protein, partial [Moraxella sp.]|uniref:tape measure protein n=1 Tax=Moraxella sp. TaxID=479 RepID=UPI0026DAA2C6
ALAINIVLGANTVNFSRNIQKATKQAEQELNGFSARIEKMFDRFTRIGNLVGFGSAAAVVQIADQYQALASKVRLATESAQEYSQVSKQLRDIANSQRASFEGVVDLYSSSQQALSALGKSQQEIVGFTKNFTTAMNVAGASSEAQKSVLLQLGQALNMGRLQGQEFNSIASQTPIVMDLIAKKMGVAKGQLKDLAAKGKITAQTIYDALATATDELAEKAAKMPATVSAAVGVVKDNIGYLVHDVLNSTGVMSHFANAIAFVGENLKTLASIGAMAATAAGVKMAHTWAVGKLTSDGLIASLTAQIIQIRTSAIETIKGAYSAQNYAANLAYLSGSAGKAAESVGGVLFSAISRTAIAIDRYWLPINVAIKNTQAWTANNLTLANSKAVLTTAISTTSSAITGYVNAQRSAIVGAVSYVRTNGILGTAKNALSAATRSATASIIAFGGAMRSGTVSAMAYTRAIATSAATKRAMVGTATLAGRAISGIGSAFASVGRIIMAHPIMLIAGVITAVIVRTMGLQKAMDSLSDAISIVGEMLGDFIDFGINNFKWLMGVVDKFFSSFLSSGKESTGFVNQYFGWLFEGTEGGFVGLLQVTARILDKMVGFFYAATRSMYRSMVNLWNGIKRGFVDAFNAVSKTIESSINGILDSYDAIIGKINGMIRDAKAAAAKVGLGGIVPKELTGTGGYRYQGVQLQAALTPGIGGNFGSDMVGFSLLGDYVDDKVKQNKAEKAAKKLEEAGKAADSTAKGLDKAGKSAKNLDKSHKDTAKSGDKLKNGLDKASEAAKKLADAFNDKMAGFKKIIWESQNVKAGLHSEQIEYDLQFGELTGLDKDQKQLLRAQSLYADHATAIAELDSKIHDLKLPKEFGTTYSEVMHGIQDERNKLSALAKSAGIVPEMAGTQVVWKRTGGGNGDLGETQIIIKRLEKLDKFEADTIAKLQEIATLETNNVVTKYQGLNDEVERQIKLLDTTSTIDKELLKIDFERADAIKPYEQMIDHIKASNKELGDYIENQLLGQIDYNIELQKTLAVKTAYKELSEQFVSDEQKQLNTLREELSVLNQMAKLDPQAQGVNATQILDKALGLNDNAQQDGVFAQLGQLNKQYEQRQAIIDEWQAKMEKNLAGHEDELSRITKEAEERRTQIKRQHQIAQVNLGLAAGNEMVGQMADFAKSAFGEQSKHYRAMFALQKGFAIASASVSLYENVSKAMSLGFPANIGAIAAATMQGVKILSLIRQIQNPIVGQAHDGIMSVPKSGTWNLEKGERVLPKHTAKALDDKLDSLQRGTGGQVVNVSVTVNADGNSDVQSSHELGKGLGNAIKLAVQAELQKERRQGGLLYGR